MPPEARTYLYDIQQAVKSLSAFTGGKAFADYEADGMLRAAVGRQFEIIGEALVQLGELDKVSASQGHAARFAFE